MGLDTDFQQGVWRNAPLDVFRYDPFYAAQLIEQFQELDTSATHGPWVLTQATTGTAAINTTSPGSLLLDAGATTDNQGVQIQRTKSAFVPAANKSLWFETKVTLSAATPPVTRAQLFVGLCAADTTIIASGAISTNNRLGWLIADGGLLTSVFTADKAGTATTTTGHTFVPATAVKLGMFYDGVADTVQAFVNGVPTGALIPTANIPKVVIYPSLVLQSDGTDRPTMLVEGMKVIQLM